MTINQSKTSWLSDYYKNTFEKVIFVFFVFFNFIICCCKHANFLAQTFPDGHQPDSCPDDDASVSIDGMDVSDFELDEKTQQATHFEVIENDQDVPPSPRPPMTPRTGARSPERRTAGRQQHTGTKETGRKSDAIHTSSQAAGVRLIYFLSNTFKIERCIITYLSS